jgi:hypothetical protein
MALQRVAKRLLLQSCLFRIAPVVCDVEYEIGKAVEIAETRLGLVG